MWQGDRLIQSQQFGKVTFHIAPVQPVISMDEIKNGATEFGASTYTHTFDLRRT